MLKILPPDLVYVDCVYKDLRGREMQSNLRREFAYGDTANIK